MPFIVDLPPTYKHIERTSIQYNKTDIDAVGNDLDLNTLKLDQDLMEHVYLTEKFNSLVSAWKKNTMIESSISRIIEDNNFQEILALEEKAIPLIINEIEKEPSILVWALNMITNSTLESKKRLTVEDACSKWVKEYKRAQSQHRIIKS